MADTKDHELNADTYPPFPSDAPVAQLETFKFDTLHSDGKSLNGQTLRSACYQHGVFYLDLTDSDPWFSQLPKSAKYLMHRLEPIFDLPQAVKDKFIFADLESKACMDVLDVLSVQAGLPVAGSLRQLHGFFRPSSDVLRVIGGFPRYSRADDHRGKDEEDEREADWKGEEGEDTEEGAADEDVAEEEDAADEDVAEEDAAEEDADEGEAVHMLLHRDKGTITILFNWLGGLQVKERDTGTMMWVEPKAGHAVVLVGAALARFLDDQDADDGTFGAWRRLVAASGAGQGEFARYSLGYFVRPEDDVLLKKATASPDSDVLCKMRRMEGVPNPKGDEGIPTAKEWISRRAG